MLNRKGNIINKINDPLGQTHSPAGSDHNSHLKLIHSANPQSRPVLSHMSSVRLSVRPHFSKARKTDKVKTMFATCETEGLAKWIINHLYYLFCFARFCRKDGSKEVQTPRAKIVITTYCGLDEWINFKWELWSLLAGRGAGRLDHWWNLSCMTLILWDIWDLDMR